MERATAIILFGIFGFNIYQTLQTNKKLIKMGLALDKLTASVGALETATAATLTEITSLQAGSDDAALNELSTRVDAATASLTGAVPAQTAPAS